MKARQTAGDMSRTRGGGCGLREEADKNYVSSACLPCQPIFCLSKSLTSFASPQSSSHPSYPYFFPANRNRLKYEQGSVPISWDVRGFPVW